MKCDLPLEGSCPVHLRRTAGGAVRALSRRHLKRQLPALTAQHLDLRTQRRDFFLERPHAGLEISLR